MQRLWRKVNVIVQVPPSSQNGSFTSNSQTLAVIYRVFQQSPRHRTKSRLLGSLVISVIHSTYWFVLHAKTEESRREKKSSPEILIHRLEEEFVVRLVQDLLKIQQSYILGSNGDLHQIRRLLFVDMINNFGFRHGCSCLSTLERNHQRATNQGEVALTVSGC